MTEWRSDSYLVLGYFKGQIIKAQNEVAAVEYEDLKKVKRYVLYTEMKEEKVEMWMGKCYREIDRKRKE